MNNKLELGVYTDSGGDFVEITEIIEEKDMIRNSIVRYKIIIADDNSILSDYATEGIKLLHEILYDDRQKINGYGTPLWRLLNE